MERFLQSQFLQSLVLILVSAVISASVSVVVFRVSLEHRLTKLETTTEIIKKKVLGE